MKQGRKPEYQAKAPADMLKKMPDIIIIIITYLSLKIQSPNETRTYTPKLVAAWQNRHDNS